MPGVDAAGSVGGSAAPARRAQEPDGDIRAARAGAIAAYRAGARAAARVQEAQQGGRAALPGARPTAEGGAPEPPHPRGPEGGPPGQIADPYGVRATPWHGAGPRHPGTRRACPHSPGRTDWGRATGSRRRTASDRRTGRATSRRRPTG
ncbi:hypothetical protein GCM10020295_31780 [Streptomyces cinereospinus]